MMASDPKTHAGHQECRQMALALEGIAGALHEGRPVQLEDLGLAASAAESVWEAGPEPGPSRTRDFEAARTRFMEASGGCAHGAAREAAQVENAALGMASHLRLTVQDAAGAPARTDLAPGGHKAIATLTSKYGRYGIRPHAAA